MPRKKATPTERAPAPAATSVPPPRALLGGRLSRDADTGLFGMRLSAIVPPSDATDQWRSLDLDSHTLSRISPFKLAEMLADVSPEVSRALWDWLRECNAGFEIPAFVVGSNEQTIDTRAQNALDAFLARLRTLYGTLDVPISRLFLSVFMRGAICSELVLDADGRSPVDLAVVDPAVVRAKRIIDPIRGSVFEYGQQIGGIWVPFDRPTISYIPVDPLPASPYGRPMIAPSLFISLFLIGLLHDLRRVIAQQGYPRYDIEIVLDEALKQMPPAARNSPAAQEQWLDSLVRIVATYYASLEPDDAFTHTSAVKLNRPLGTLNAESLGAVPAIIEALERMASRSLKSVPFMLGLTESTTESQSNRQFEQHAITIRSMQHLVETQLGHHLTLALQAQGIVADVCVRFSENRASEETRDEQVRQLKIANATAGYQAGLISQNDAAMYAFGKEAADQPEPRAAAVAPVSDGAQANPDPSASRVVPPTTRSARAKLVPLGHDQPLDPVPDADLLNDEERAALMALWDRSVTAKYRGILDATVVNGEGG